jgi:pimeloyl-ACP methyl ester carboxylesterase
VSFTPSHRGGSGEPLVLLHGFTDTWRTWELLIPALERRFNVLAPTLAGHAGGPPLEEEITSTSIVGAVERAMDEAGVGVANIVGNSLGGFIAMQLAERGRARTVVAFAPAGGWPEGSWAYEETFRFFETVQELVSAAAPYADSIVASPEGRRRATEYTTTNYEHIPAELLAHQIRGAASCDGVFPLLEYARRAGYRLDAERITCPVRIVWGTADRVLPWPSAAARYREQWVPQADWVELEGVGHCPQLDVPLETAQLIIGFSSR